TTPGRATAGAAGPERREPRTARARSRAARIPAAAVRRVGRGSAARLARRGLRRQTPNVFLADAPRGIGLRCALAYLASERDVYGWFLGARDDARTVSAFF